MNLAISARVYGWEGALPGSKAAVLERARTRRRYFARGFVDALVAGVAPLFSQLTATTRAVFLPP